MKSLITGSLTAIFFSVLTAGVFADDIKLPEPQTNIGKPLMRALSERASTRKFDSAKKLNSQSISNLLWATFGVNRPARDGRTAPSTRNWKEIDVYVFTENGVYVYDPVKNILKEQIKADKRAITGKQDFVQKAQLVLLFVADYERVKSDSLNPQETDKYVWIDAGYLSQNTYLFCASENLGTVAIGNLDRAAAEKELKLKPTQKIIISQPVGFQVSK